MPTTPVRVAAKASAILESIYDYLSDNSELKQFCWDNFNSVGIVQVGLDSDAPPRPEELPAIVIGPVQRAEKGDNNRELNFLVFASVTISEKQVDVVTIDNGDLLDNDVSTKTQGKRNVKGFLLVEKLREEVERLILCSRISPYKKDLAGETLTESDFPIFRSSTAITFSTPRSNRGPLE